MAPATTALPYILLLSLLAAASPSHSSSLEPSSSPSSSPVSRQELSKTSISNGKRAAGSTRDWESAAKGQVEDGEDEMTGAGKSAEPIGEGVHKIQVREAGPVRFWSGSRYGRSGRSGGSGTSGSQSRGSDSHTSREMTMSLRSSNPVVQPRHDRFFLGSRYGKRSQGQEEEWEGRRRGVMGEEEEEEEVAEETAPEENEEEGEEKAEDAARMLEEAMQHFRAIEETGKSGGMTSQRGRSLEIQPVSCVYTGIGNLYRCYDGRHDRREATGVH